MSKKDDEGKLVTRDDTSLVETDYEPLDHLSTLQQRFAMMQVTTTMTNAEIGRALGISNSTRYKWNKDEHVQAYIQACKVKYTDAQINETARMQVKYIRENLFKEMMDRMRDPEEALKEWIQRRHEMGLPEPSMQEITEFNRRFLGNVPFSELYKVWEKVEKSFRLDAGAATEITSEGDMVTEVRRKYARFREKAQSSKSYAEIAREAVAKGMTLEDYQRQLAAEDDGVIEAEIVEDDDSGYDEVVLEEWEIRRNK